MQSSAERAFIEFVTTGTFGTITASTTESEVLALLPHIESYTDGYTWLSDDDIEFIFLNHVLHRVKVRVRNKQTPQWTKYIPASWYSFVQQSTSSKIEGCLQTHIVSYRDFYFYDGSHWLAVRKQPIGFNFERAENGALLEIYIHYLERQKWRRGVYEKVVDFPEVPNQVLPKNVVCLESHGGALTKGKTYAVVKFDEYKGFVRVVGDNGRTRWFRWEYFDLPE